MNPARIIGVILLLILIAFLLACDQETDLDPVYQPAVEKQFGDITAFVQEVSFQKNGFKIVGDLRTPLTGDKHPAIIMVHGSGPGMQQDMVQCHSNH